MRVKGHARQPRATFRVRSRARNPDQESPAHPLSFLAGVLLIAFIFNSFLRLEDYFPSPLWGQNLRMARLLECRLSHQLGPGRTRSRATVTKALLDDQTRDAFIEPRFRDTEQLGKPGNQ